jgi:hypothetical protein
MIMGMLRRGAKAKLYLNDECVGDVDVVSSSTSWGFGHFRPNETFSKFATVFGRWSLLLHAQDATERMDKAALDALRDAEQAMDSLRARLLDPMKQAWYPIGQLNIDGPLLEWKEY